MGGNVRRVWVMQYSAYSQTSPAPFPPDGVASLVEGSRAILVFTAQLYLSLAALSWGRLPILGTALPYIGGRCGPRGQLGYASHVYNAWYAMKPITPDRSDTCG